MADCIAGNAIPFVNTFFHLIVTAAEKLRSARRTTEVGGTY